MKSRRVAAATALGLGAAALVLVVATAARGFPRGLVVAGLLFLAFVAAWEAIRRRNRARMACAAVAVLLLAATFVVLLRGRVWAELILAGVLFALATVAARSAFRLHVALPVAIPPSRPVVVWNPRSGGGKAKAAHVDDEARARGIEPIELRPGDDLPALVRDAVARGADALAAAGGDGTQALVAGIAAELDLPFVCIPAGTRNHFALDLGVDRTDVVGALDAFVAGGERRVDLAEVNGRVVVNNVSLGLYAEAVRRPDYRDAKLRVMLDTVPEFAGMSPSDDNELHFTGPRDAPDGRAIVIQVSNNSYRLGTMLGSGDAAPHRRRSARDLRAHRTPRRGITPHRVAPVDGGFVRGRGRPARSGRCRRRGADARPAPALHDSPGRAPRPHRAAPPWCLPSGSQPARHSRRRQTAAAHRSYWRASAVLNRARGGHTSRAGGGSVGRRRTSSSSRLTSCTRVRMPCKAAWSATHPRVASRRHQLRPPRTPRRHG